MPETPPIPPALSAEQWATARAWPHGLADYVAGVGEDMTYSDYAPEKLHAIVALANAALPDGDPRKVTREDVDLANAFAHGWPPESSEARRIVALAAKLAALLPPTEEPHHG